MGCLSFVIFISYQIESMAAQEEEMAPGKKKRKKKKKAKSTGEGAGGGSSEPVIYQEPPKFEVKKITEFSFNLFCCWEKDYFCCMVFFEG